MQSRKTNSYHSGEDYIASYHAPNIMAINNYFRLLQNENEIIIYVGGAVSHAIKQNFTNVHI